MRLVQLMSVGALAALVPVTGVAQSASIQHLRVSVAATNDEWTPTGFAVSPGDVILIRSAGRVRIGQRMGEVDANGHGSGHQGALTLKIGTGAAVRVGARGFVVAEEAGPVKLRVQDTRYTDNTGTYNVDVIFIPSGAIPAAVDAKP